MFSKAKTTEGAAGATEAPTAPGKARKASPKALPKASGVPSLISADVVIRGSVVSDGEVQFDGEIEGDLHAKGLVIGEGARVKGEVVAETVRVCGTVEGSIRAARVELAAGSLVRGEVTHADLAVETGAKFEGTVRHAADPAAEAPVPGGKSEPTADPVPPAAEKALRRMAGAA